MLKEKKQNKGKDDGGLDPTTTTTPLIESDPHDWVEYTHEADWAVSAPKVTEGRFSSEFPGTRMINPESAARDCELEWQWRHGGGGEGKRRVVESGLI